MPHHPACQAIARFRVIDMTQARAGPTAARQLADWGADQFRCICSSGRAMRTLLCIALIAFVCGCSPLMPYHTVMPSVNAGTTPIDCGPDASWLPQVACASLLVEKGRDYDLFYAEFDDQGWPFRSPQFGDAKHQVNYAVEGIADSILRNQRVSIVTFVHGWKHNASFDDPDVAYFRQLLTGLNHIESVDDLGCRRRIVGVYAGWRGKSLEVDDNLQNITFWDRKNTAGKVAQGSIRELFARIRALQINGNQSSSANSESPCIAHPVRSMIIGHSFGGLIVYSVLSEALIRDIVDIRQAPESQVSHDVLSRSREGDLVVLVNPAIEATRFDALAMTFSESQHWNRYHAPLFVSITSIDDLATRIAFPLGRQISTVFESYTPGVGATQRNANLATLGQDDEYITMDLSTLDQYNSLTPPGKQLAPLDTCAGYAQTFPKGEELKEHVRRERATFTRFKLALGTPPDASNAYPRQFCGRQDLVLSLIDGSSVKSVRVADPNMPVWNIRTRSPIVESHGDITNPLLWQFVRQLYYDSEDDSLKSLLK